VLGIFLSSGSSLGGRHFARSFIYIYRHFLGCVPGLALARICPGCNFLLARSLFRALR
jgi:putative AlgH/UPF0301 family transcriptional regulator